MVRIHPTEVDEGKMIRIKRDMVEGNLHYVFPFSKHSYCEIEIHNKKKLPTRSTPEFVDAMHTLGTGRVIKPVVFFICYEIGYRKDIDVFVSHVVCCIANKVGSRIEICMFDMRNLNEIDKDHQKAIETEIGKQIRFSDVHITNIACLEQEHCLYLQRFRKKTDVGWCMAWALFFLDSTILHPIHANKYAHELSWTIQKRAYTHIYRIVEAELRAKKSNELIEIWFQSLLREY